MTSLLAPTTDWKIVDVGDYNNDAKDDILWRDMNSGQVGNWLSGGDGTFAPNATSIVRRSTGTSPAIINFWYDGDGRHPGTSWAPASLACHNLFQ